MGRKSARGSHPAPCFLPADTEPPESHCQGSVGKEVELGTFVTVKPDGEVNALQVLGAFQERGFEVVGTRVAG